MIYITIEYTLNKKYIYDEDGEVIGEENFTVPFDWLDNLYKEYFKDKYSSFEDFLKCYIPEEDGEFIYNKAVEEDVLIIK